MKLLILWHMHQPYYKNPISGEFELPWVFLHGIKDYIDMPWQAGRFKGLKITFNLTPSLIVQLNEYSRKEVKCRFLNLMKKKVNDLSLEEKKFLARFFLNPSMKRLSERVSGLKDFLIRFEKEPDIDKFCREVEDHNFLKLQVLYLLSWCGEMVRRSSKVVKELLKRDGVFTEEEKLELIYELQDYLSKVIPLYKKLQEEGKAEITVSPFYHPILPLLINVESARESTPNVKLPSISVSLREDAVVQVKRAVELYKEIFGKEPEGVWPAEGGVSNEALELLSGVGFKWGATDEEVLFKSLIEKVGNKSPLYKAYSYRGKLKLFFRDRELSDLIGFTYKTWKEEDAVKDFISRLRKIEENYPNSVVSVILDGENCWEYYRNNGFEFREELYKALTENNWIETSFFSQVEPEGSLNSVVAGSWINGNFLNWVGDDEKNRAWELLGITRAEIDQNEEALERVLVAEGSDWFWWFGRGHRSEFVDEFDRLFRSNLIDALRIARKRIPKELLSPIKEKVSLSTSPSYYIKPEIDGEVTSYFEWLNAGRVELTSFSTTESSCVYMKELYYGYDREGNLYIRIDGSWDKLKGKEVKVILELFGREHKRLSIKVGEGSQECPGIKSALKKVLEIFIPSPCIKEFMGGRVNFTVKLVVDGAFIEEAPFLSYGVLELCREFENEWMV